MDQKLVVVFGKPGAGKTYIADILEKQFGYFSINGDEALPADMKEKILEKRDVTRDMRTRFVQNIIDEVTRLSTKRDTIVVHQALIKEHMRLQLRESFPQAVFVWVDCDDAILKKRYMKRRYFNLGLAYLQKMLDAFETPKHPHIRIDNNEEGISGITRQLSKIQEHLR